MADMAAKKHKARKGRARTHGRRERERGRHRAEILDAAEAIMMEKGLHGTSIQDIASRADFAVGTLYKFFPSKDELYACLFEEKVKEIWGMIKRALESASEPLDKIERLIEVSTDVTVKYGGFFQIYMSETAGTFMVRPMTIPYLRKRHKRFEKLVAGILAEGIERGLIRRMDPRYAAMGLIGLQRGLNAMWVDERKRDVEPEELTEMVKDAFFGGMLTEEGKRLRSSTRGRTSTTNLAAQGSEQ